ncbi:MAG TPA: type III pantothenate kinase [Bacteroidota bacterium]
MVLAIDIGNTHTVLGVFEREKLLFDWRISSSLQHTEDEVGTSVRLFLTDAGIDPKRIDGIGISSVVPDLTDIYAAMTRKYFQTDPLIVSSEVRLGISIHYDDPKAVGADRLCNAIAAFAKHGGPLIIIDFGTATTYDVVAKNGDYLGGVIAPGIETSAADLHRRAAKLPKVELRFPSSLIGTDTTSSMQAGILYGAVDAMEGMIGRLQRELKKREATEGKLIATGGFSKFICDYSKLPLHWEPSLVLEGVRLVYERVRDRTTDRRS